MAKNLYIKTFGCQMNVYDSARMADLLTPLGYQLTDGVEDADLVVLNTCHIREKAAEKVYSELGRLRKIKEARNRTGDAMLLCVAGCVAQAEGREVASRAPYVDIVIGPQSYHRLPAMVERATTQANALVDTTFPAKSKFDYLPEEFSANMPGRGVSSFLTVQEGCDRFCTFCVVPYTRGIEDSRSVKPLMAEATRLAAAGARDLTLLGQNVNAYHGWDGGKEVGLASLIQRLATIEDVWRLRYTTSHPRDMTDALIRMHRIEPKLMPFLHLPVQSGSDSMLEAMNRGHTVDGYRGIITKLRAAKPNIALSTDLIVGFPGETDEDFSDTLDLVAEVGFSQGFLFKYSIRPGTPAANLPDQIPEDVKTERLAKLRAVVDRQQRNFNERVVGKDVRVLFERTGRHDGQIAGRSPHMQWVNVYGGQELIGKMADVKITKASTNALVGDVLNYSIIDTLGGAAA